MRIVSTLILYRSRSGTNIERFLISKWEYFIIDMIIADNRKAIEIVLLCSAKIYRISIIKASSVWCFKAPAEAGVGTTQLILQLKI